MEPKSLLPGNIPTVRNLELYNLIKDKFKNEQN